MFVLLWQFLLALVIMWMLRFSLLICCFVVAELAPAEDLVTNLPGLSEMTRFKQYSGYLDASSTKHLHYWFVESQRDPAGDPIVLWLNGGPGCSSLDGLLSENGPIHVNNDGNTMRMNPYSWNKLANVLYLESPAGVGYSYDDNDDVSTDDDKVANHNYAALQHFFKKFPEYAGNDFYITGESYGGIYIPTLTLLVAKDNKYKLKGFAVGNGLSSYKLNDDSLVYFAYYHGLFGEKLWSDLHASCCKGGISRQNCTFHPSGSVACSDCVAKVSSLVYSSGLNEYALYRDCEDVSTSMRGKAYQFTMDNLFRNLDPKVRNSIKSQALRTSRTLKEEPNCINSTAIEHWLNKKEVRDALHIATHVPKWEICSGTVSSNYKRTYSDMGSVYKELLKYPEIRVLIYNGDTDMACNFLGDQWFIADLNLPQTHGRAPWYVEGQVGGFARQFKKLTFTTIRGAGHMVPQWAPAYSYYMFDKFLKDEPLIE